MPEIPHQIWLKTAAASGLLFSVTTAGSGHQWMVPTPLRGRQATTSFNDFAYSARDGKLRRQ
jgi:hypothetical protein